ncbi:enoyl-CoA hydratase/isomerase family protein [Jatrophihabitans endophyticus]|uniref:enoyl-CoA hydratase/isomerase family protein n=1 Tax=Jatrophihabitans endophyticus TaxID=1206085 RepID=UPI0019DA9CB9|nr:enoyl-CoA hydratase/isomerase family protein [Jatrophihabitans endophyticus]MBE7188439.1 enoyl-CoA hydratase/isomerase family protein [Jatrophihabitans endophyticus]
MDTTDAPALPDTRAYAGFRVEYAPARATVVLDRPDRLNCQSPAMWDDLVRARRELPGDVRVVVLRAEGRAFSAGLDRAVFTSTGADNIAALGTLPADEATARIAGWQRAFDWSSSADLVTIAAVQGHAIGGGFQLALGCDIRIVADDVLFCMAEPTLGIVPDLGGTKRLVDLVGVSRATEICLTGRRVDAAEALRIGLASHVVPAGELDAAVERTAAAVLGIDRNAAAETKALLQRAPGRSQDEQQAAEREAQYRRLRTIAGLDAEA